MICQIKGPDTVHSDSGDVKQHSELPGTERSDLASSVESTWFDSNSKIDVFNPECSLVINVPLRVSKQTKECSAPMLLLHASLKTSHR